jgi:uncharacterized membrane-anchored protein
MNMSVSLWWRSGFRLAAAAIALATGLSIVCLPAAEATNKSTVNWVRGPATASLKNTAEIKVPQGYKFANAEDTQRLLKAAGEPTSGHEMGMLLPEEGGWTLFFEFSSDGYVKDDDKDKLDADKMLKSISQGNEYANKKRVAMGNPPLKIVGWEKPPSYDPVSHNLEWAIRGESEGQSILNYNIRLLGRKGVMEVVLVCDPEKLGATLPTMKDLLAGYVYKSGESYAEYRPGDKIAKYGLAALVTGGAVAVAAKTGLLAGLLLFFKKGWKLLVLAVVAVLSFFKRLALGGKRRDAE